MCNEISHGHLSGSDEPREAGEEAERDQHSRDELDEGGCEQHGRQRIGRAWLRNWEME
jgi:hypothetical protein